MNPSSSSAFSISHGTPSYNYISVLYWRICAKLLVFYFLYFFFSLQLLWVFPSFFNSDILFVLGELRVFFLGPTGIRRIFEAKDEISWVKSWMNSFLSPTPSSFFFSLCLSSSPSFSFTGHTLASYKVLRKHCRPTNFEKIWLAHILFQRFLFPCLWAHNKASHVRRGKLGTTYGMHSNSNPLYMILTFGQIWSFTQLSTVW